MSREDVLALKAFDFYFDELGKLFSRAEGNEFKRHYEKVFPSRPVWVVVWVDDAEADVSIVIKSWNLGSTCKAGSSGANLLTRAHCHRNEKCYEED